jgi:cobalt-zinc-cadmium efflux system outer membrane protein
VETATTSLAEVDKVIAVNRARYQQGEVAGGELRRLEVERMKFTDDVLAAQLAEKNERAALLALLGATRLDAPLEPTDGLAVAKGVLPEASGPGQAPPGGAAGQSADLIARALATRPDLAAAREEQARADAELKLQQALRTPTVVVGAGYRRDFGENGLVVTASLPLPLFDRNAGGVARAEAERRVAANQAREARRVVSLDVQQAINTVGAARERLAALESDYLQKAREARDTALSAYRSGATDLIDYLDAQRAYRDVQRAYQRALFDHRVSQLQLDAAVGVAPGELQP